MWSKAQTALPQVRTSPGTALGFLSLLRNKPRLYSTGEHTRNAYNAGHARRTGRSHERPARRQSLLIFSRLLLPVERVGGIMRRYENCLYSQIFFIRFQYLS